MPDNRVMKMFVWTDHIRYLAVAHAESTIRARGLLRAEVEPDGDGSWIRAIAWREISESAPCIWNGPNAEFALTDSGNVEEIGAVLEHKERVINAALKRLDSGDVMGAISALLTRMAVKAHA